MKRKQQLLSGLWSPGEVKGLYSAQNRKQLHHLQVLLCFYADGHVRQDIPGYPAPFPVLQVKSLLTRVVFSVKGPAHVNIWIKVIYASVYFLYALLLAECLSCMYAQLFLSHCSVVSGQNSQVTHYSLVSLGYQERTDPPQCKPIPQ